MAGNFPSFQAINLNFFREKPASCHHNMLPAIFQVSFYSSLN
ncbi:hypothetical protein DDI_2767 [Dickeya dianthicola RNS04.9]|nr:hypothetical protein DDI_2767 [Dickeya dianthicola RNS04.9]